MSDTAFYDAVTKVTDTTLVTPELAGFVLIAHIIIGLSMAYVGSKGSQWE
jgi:hypothetical protein